MDPEQFHSGYRLLPELHSDEHGMESGRTGRFQRCRTAAGEQRKQWRSALERLRIDPSVQFGVHHLLGRAVRSDGQILFVLRGYLEKELFI